MNLLIFDIDGTLVHSDRRDSHCFARAYESVFGHPFPTLDWHQFFHVTDTILLETALQQHTGRPPQIGEVQRLHERYLEDLRAVRLSEPHCFQEVPGARAFFDSVRADPKFEVVVATGGWRAPAHIKLEHIGIACEDLIIVGADGKRTREDILLDAIDRAWPRNQIVEQVVYIGDARWDVRTTHHLGIGFVGMRHRGDTEVLKALGAAHVFSNYQEPEKVRAAIHQAQPPVFQS